MSQTKGVNNPSRIVSSYAFLATSVLLYSLIILDIFKVPLMEKEKRGRQESDFFIHWFALQLSTAVTGTAPSSPVWMAAAQALEPSSSGSQMPEQEVGSEEGKPGHKLAPRWGILAL